MSKYDELSAQALALVSRYKRIEDLCESKAWNIVQRFAARLGAPDDRIGTLEVDDELRIKGPLCALRSRLNLRHGKDGRWYFGLWLKYGKPLGEPCYTEAVVVAIRAHDEQGARISVGLLDDAEYDASNEAELDAFFDKLIQDTENRLERNFAEGRRGIGFTVPNET